MKTFSAITFSGIALLALVACEATQSTESATPTDETRASADSIPLTPIETGPTAPKTQQLTTLAIGDDAPAITVNKWVKGGAVGDFEDGKIYVMEFWATWCGPCLVSIPHLTKIQEEYADNNVSVIGCAIWQREDTQDARETSVTTFVEEQGDKMNYTVAVDNENWMSDNWMKPAGRNGIPSAFIIDGTGTVAWIGNSFSIDEPLKQIVDGTWDLAAAAEAFKKEQTQDMAMMAFSMTLRNASNNEDWDGYIEAIDSFTAEYGENTQLANMKFNALLSGKQDKVAAYALAEEIVEADWDSANSLNAMAWGIVDETPNEFQNLDFALKVADRACELTDYKDPMILDTLARCYWEMGDRYKAIAWQEKAVEYSDEDSMGDSIQATLDEYQATLANVDE